MALAASEIWLETAAVRRPPSTSVGSEAIFSIEVCRGPSSVDTAARSSGQPPGAGYVTSLGPDGVDAAEQHVLDRRWVDVDAPHERLQHVGAEVRGVDLAQPSGPLADRGSHRVDDVRLAHLTTTTEDPWP